MSKQEELQDKFKMQYASLKWVYEMELVDDPQLINNLKLNLFSISAAVKEIELLASYHQKAILVWLELGWFGRRFLREKILLESEERLKMLLPNFRFRVITDRNIFDLAVKKAKSITKGENDEAANVSSNANRSSGIASESELRKESDVLPDKKEQS